MKIHGLQTQTVFSGFYISAEKDITASTAVILKQFLKTKKHNVLEGSTFLNRQLPLC